MSKTALILTIGQATEPSIKRINTLEPDFVYFIHSTKSKENALFIIEETGVKNYKFKLLDDHESVDDAFIKSLDCINELKDDYKVIGDFTVGTKPMVAGLVMACIDQDCKYVYLGESDEDSRHEGMGPVKSGQEKTKNQENPYENYAINEFRSGREFFDKFQFAAAFDNFSNAEKKLKYLDLKQRSNIFMKIVRFYDSWDKFNDTLDDIQLNRFLDEIILKKINQNESLREYFENEIPEFYAQMKRNKIFLDKKITSKTSQSIIYYLPDLLNNAKRRIREGKYDDAVARLYRSMELISQIRLNQYNLLDTSKIDNNKTFFVDKKKVKNKATKEVLAEIDNWNPNGWRKSNVEFLDFDLSKNYKLLKFFSKDTKYDLTDSTCKLVSNYYKINSRVQKRNTSILAHGLKPLNKVETNNLYKLVLNHSKKLCEDIEKEMDLAKFPNFEGE